MIPRLHLRLLILALALSLQGCVLSLHPLFTKDTLVFNQELIGTWSDDDTSWRFEKSGEKTYTLVYTDGDGQAGEFDAALVSIDGKLFLDLLPKDPSGDAPPYWKFHFLKCHTFLHVPQIGPELQLRAMNPNWMKDYLEENPDAIEGTLIENRPVLTARTEDLQKLVAKLADHSAEDDDGPFGKLSTFAKEK